MISIGVRITIRHYYDFGVDRAVVGDDLVSPEAWDDLRIGTSSVFAIPSTRDEFIRLAEARPDLEARARAIDERLETRKPSTVASYGVGGAALEWWLLRLRPTRNLILTDYGEATVERLSAILPNADIRIHDLRRNGPLDADVHLFHRIDTELDNREWQDVFKRFASVPILFVATGVLDLRSLLAETGTRPRMWRKRASRAGFSRSRAAFEALWRSTHKAQAIQMHDLQAWELSPTEEGPRPAFP